MIYSELRRMKVVDTHCHLYLPEFDPDRSEVINRSESEGVSKIYLPAIDSTVINSLLQTELDYPGKCVACMGLHPCSVKENYREELRITETWLAKRKFAAVGEIGLDFYWDRTFTEQQYDAFKMQIGWAKKYRLPIIIHSRNSLPECIKMVREYHDESLFGIFHCFGGSLEEARQITELGFFLGIGGVVTYKNSGLPAVVEQLSLDNLVMETDAPYLTPAPFRGKRNESSYLKYIVRSIAEIKKAPVQEVAEITTLNAQKIFGN